MERKKREILYPKDPNASIIVSDQVFNDDSIKNVIMDVLSDEALHSLVVVGPFISTYFIDILSKETNLKRLVLITNSDDYNPEYVNNAIEKLKYVKFQVRIRKRKKGTTFMHMKILLPILYEDGKFTDFCALIGSVNFTRRGINTNDELLMVVKEPTGIAVVEETIFKIKQKTDLVYDTFKDFKEREPNISGLLQ